MDPILIADGSWIGGQWTLFLLIGASGAALVRWRWWAAWPTVAIWAAAVASAAADLLSTGTDDLAVHVAHAVGAAAVGLALPAGALLVPGGAVWLRLRGASRNETPSPRPA